MSKALRHHTGSPYQLSIALTSGSLVEVDVDALKLKVGVASISSSGVNAVLVRDNLPAKIRGALDKVHW